MRPTLPLPRGWNRRAKSVILYILALSHYTFTVLLARAANSKNRQVRLRAQIDRRDREIALLQEELRHQGCPDGTGPTPYSPSLCTAGAHGDPRTPGLSRLV